MHNAVMTTRGRTTLPKCIRRQLGLNAKTSLVFSLMANGTVLIKVAQSTANLVVVHPV